MSVDYSGTSNGLFTHLGKLIKHFDLVQLEATDESYGLDADRKEMLDVLQAGTVGNPDLASSGLASVVELWKQNDINRRATLAGYIVARLRDRVTVRDEIGASSQDQAELLRQTNRCCTR